MKCFLTFDYFLMETALHSEKLMEGTCFIAELLWTAPELLRLQRKPQKGTQKGDVYSFAIILSEIFMRCHPYYYNNPVSVKGDQI